MRGLMRPAAALFPLAGLVAMVAGGGELPWSLLLHYFIIQLFTLCAVASFRNGAAREPGVRRVDRRFGGALAQLALGGLLLAIVWFKAGFPKNLSVGMFAAAGCVTLEQLFEERMYALGRRVDGAILSVIANVLLLAGLLLDAADGIELAGAGRIGCPFTLGLAALGVLIAVGSSYAVEPAHGFSVKPVNLAQSPTACAQTLLYPAAALGSSIALPATMRTATIAAPLFCGLILWRLARTVCRRTREESRPLNLMLICLAAVPALVAGVLPELCICGAGLIYYAVAAALAVVCAAIVFCAPSLRLWSGIALLVAGDALLALRPLPGNWSAFAGCACAVLAALLNAHRAFMRPIKRPEF